MPPVTAPARVGEIRFKQETTANEAIATPSTYWAATPKKVKAWDVKDALTRIAEDDPSMVLRSLEDRQRLLLAKEGTLGWRCWLTGLTASTPAQDDLGLALKGALGGESLGGASTTVDAANTGAGATAPLKVTSATGMVAGSALKIVSTSRTELRRIVSISGTDITLDHDLAAVYTSGTIYQAATYYPDPDALENLNDSGHITFAVLWRGAHSEEQKQARGCFLGVELADLGVNRRPKLDFTAYPQDWDYVSSVAALSAWTEASSPNQVNSGLYIQNQGTATNNVIHTMALDVKLGLPVERIMSPVGENGVMGHTAFGGRTSLEFETFFDVSDWFDKFEAGTKLLAGYQIGNDVLISFPQLSIDEAPEPVGAGAEVRRVKVKMHADEGPVTTTDLTRARFAIHRFLNT
jgi:hypothetical protein